IYSLSITLRTQTAQALGMDAETYREFSDFVQREFPTQASKIRSEALHEGTFGTAKHLRDVWLNNSAVQSVRFTERDLLTIPGSYEVDGVAWLKWKGHSAPIRAHIAAGTLKVTPR